MTATCQHTFSVTHLRNKSSVLSLGRALFWLQMQAEAHHLLFVTIENDEEGPVVLQGCYTCMPRCFQ